ncbi:MAG TPA: GIY-YIG nuclease family protein [Pyrinomonadaceae bacterium]|jgi:group I intron endonuclease
MSKGIYCIRNSITGERYVGSSVNIEARWLVHKAQLNRRCHHSFKLQAAWNRYGQRTFFFEIIEEIIDKENKTLAQREQHWLDHYDSYRNGYNSNPIASRPFTLTDEERDLRAELIRYGLYEPKYVQQIKSQNPLKYDLEKQKLWEAKYESVRKQRSRRILYGWLFFIVAIISWMLLAVKFSPMIIMLLPILIWPLIIVSMVIGSSKSEELEELKKAEPRSIAQQEQDKIIKVEKEKRRRIYIPRRRWY